MRNVCKLMGAAGIAAALSVGCDRLPNSAPDAGTDEAAMAAAEMNGACAAIADMTSEDFVVKSAEVSEKQINIPFPPPGIKVKPPAHCLVQGALNPRTGEDGRHYEIGFELRMPLEWNGRFVFQGGGGLDGVIRPALGMTGIGTPPALSQGFAVVSTDAGHQGMDASFATDTQARIDYAYNALEVVTRKAKELLAEFYGAQADYSYFVGCSNGGRQGMMAAQRFPDLFDGIVAGDPGFRLSRAAVAEVWDTAQFARVAPRDAKGRPIISQAFSDAELKLVADGALDVCDGLDGLEDGMINNVAACQFDPGVLECDEGEADRCLSAEKIDVLHEIFNGAHDSEGRPLYASWPYDTGITGRDWRMWKLGTSRSGKPNGLNQLMGEDALARYFAQPPVENLDPSSFDFDKAASLVAETGAINDPVSTMSTEFRDRGGRLVIYQGVSDPVFSADDITAWYDQVTEDTGSLQSWARLFLVPGMNHCAGGPATDQFDAFAAIQAWVEKDEAPDRIAAAGAAFPGVSRPLCPYPSYAHYSGGDVDHEASFECRTP